MPYYHVRLTTRTTFDDELALDLSREELERRFLEPRRQGKSVTLRGKTFEWDEIERLRINQTERSAEQLLPEIQAEQAASSVIVAIPDEWYVTEKGRDVTDELVTAPVGTEATLAQDSDAAQPEDARRVMVVHGRDEDARRDVFSFLRAIDLRPREWSSLVQETSEGSPYVGQVLHRAFQLAQAVVVLFTPDDEARLREDLRGPDEPPHEVALTGQPRQNVLFEAGLALAHHPRRTVLVEVGSIRPISDLEGRHAVRLNGTADRLQDLARRLEQAGCPVDLNGDDWQRPGNFPGLIPAGASRQAPQTLASKDRPS